MSYIGSILGQKLFNPEQRRTQAGLRLTTVGGRGDPAYDHTIKPTKVDGGVPGCMKGWGAGCFVATGLNLDWVATAF